MSNDKACAIARKGQIKIRMHDGVVRTVRCQTCSKIKEKSYFSRHFACKLFGYKIKEDHINLSKATLAVIKGQRSTGNIYRLMGNTVQVELQLQNQIKTVTTKKFKHCLDLINVSKC